MPVMQNAYFPHLTDGKPFGPYEATGLWGKRMLDITLSIIAILFLSPFAVVIAITIRLASRGPVLFRQRRVGYQGREFTILKFRSMLTNNDDSRHREFMHKLISGSHTSEGNGTKLRYDQRVTAIGRVLRRTCLDEIPQLVNVLRGEMSLVGPRPAIPYEYQCYDAWHKLRVRAIPGITGLWQISNRERMDFNSMVALDLTYIHQQSFMLDLKILLLTPLAILAGKGTS